MTDLSSDLGYDTPSVSQATDGVPMPDLDGLEQKYNLPSGLLSSVMHQESGGDPDAVSDAGAQGLFQFEPRTAKQYGIDPFDPNQAADGAARMYADLSKKYKGDVPSMLAAYNWGQGNVDRKGLGGAPKETRDYINNIMEKMGNPKTEIRMASMEPLSDVSYESAPQGRDLSDELYGNQSSEGRDLSAELYGSAPEYSTDPARAAYQGVMNNVAKPLNTAVNSVVAPVMGAVASAGASPAQGAANAIDSTGAGQWIGDKLLETKNAVSNIGGRMSSNLEDLESYNPDIKPDLAALGENAQLAGNLAAIKGAGKAITSATQPAADSFAASKAANLATKPISFDPLVTHSAISDSYGAAKEAVKPYYNLMQTIGAGETANASELKPALDSMIADIQNTPFHEATSELSYLKQQAAKIGENGTMPLNDMVKLKQNLNSNFNPKRFAQGADTPYAKVGSLVDDSLSDAGKRIPEFSDAKSLADKQWLNTVKSPFEDNKVLQQFWKPEDYYAKKSVENGMLEELPDATQQRAGKLLSKIATPVDLNAVRRVLPQDLAGDLSQAKIADIKAGNSKIGQVGQAAWNAGNMQFSSAGKNLLNAVKTQFSPQERALINAAKTPSPALSTKYAKPFQQLKAQVQQMKDSAGEMQPVSYPKYPTSNYSPVQPQKMLPAPANIKPQLALPAPNTLVASPREPFRAMTAEEQIRAADPQNSIGLSAEETQPPVARNDPRAPTNSKELAQQQAHRVAQSQWDEESNRMASQGLSFKQIVNKLGARPESFKVGGAVRGFAKGGMVNTNPTDAQKEAGNYKKHHVRLHGMEIAIENPKGSVRSGRDKGGKEWHVGMPAHYGYIKGTVGADKEHMDVYVGDKPHSGRVYVVNQVHDHNGHFDEHKVILGHSNKTDAIDMYKKAFSDGKGSMRIGSVKAMSVQELKDWLKRGNTKRAA